MKDNIVELSQKIPSFNDFITNKLLSKCESQISNISSNTEKFDPHKLMLQRNTAVEYGMSEINNIPDAYPQEDIQQLEDFCKKMGIIGVSTKQHPKLILRQLKQQLGNFNDVPLNDRVVDGYEKLSIRPNTSDVKFLHNNIPNNKIILNG